MIDARRARAQLTRSELSRNTKPEGAQNTMGSPSPSPAPSSSPSLEPAAGSETQPVLRQGVAEPKSAQGSTSAVRDDEAPSRRRRPGRAKTQAWSPDAVSVTVDPDRGAHDADEEVGTWDQRMIEIERARAGRAWCCQTPCSSTDDGVDDEVARADTNAILCPEYRLFKVFRAILGPAISLPIVATVSILTGLSYMLVAVWAEENQSVPSETRILLWLTGMCSVAIVIPTVYTADSIRSAIFPDGPLDYLGMGRTLISLDAKDSLDRWAVFHSVMAVLCVLSGLYTIRQPFLQDEPPFCRAVTGVCDEWNTVFVMLSLTRGLTMIVCVPIMFPGMLSLHLATALGTDAIAEAMADIRALEHDDADITTATSSNTVLSSPTSATAMKEREWDTAETSALELATNTMPCLSAGWSGIVVGMWGIGWISATLLFCDGLTGRTTQLVGAGVMTLVPLLIAWPLAQTSTQCSNLIDHLNKQRMFNLALHERLTALETALRQHNMGKGKFLFLPAWPRRHASNDDAFGVAPLLCLCRPRICSGRHRGRYTAVVTSVSWSLLNNVDSHTHDYIIASRGPYSVFFDRPAGACMSGSIRYAGLPDNNRVAFAFALRSHRNWLSSRRRPQ
eukprot:COSAG06_NODE_539_length_14478_cov_12.490716_2_plen_620_part_00